MASDTEADADTSTNAPDVEAKSDSDGENVMIDWDGDNDPENPYNWSLGHKWLIAGTVCFVAFIVGINSTSITAAAEVINARFGISDEHFPNSFWPVTSWNTAAGLVPMLLMPLMENFGIRNWYLCIYVMFTLFIIPQALAPNFATLIVTRAFAGAFGGVLQNICDAIIADLWEGEHARSLPLTLYVFCYLGGVTFGPVFGGAVVSGLEWRWMFYIQLIIYGAFFPVVFFVLPETRPPIILKNRAKKLDPHHEKPTKAAGAPDLTLTELLNEAAIRPAHLLFTEPAIFSMTLLSSFAFGLVFNATQSVGAHVFPDTFGFNEAQAGMVQASILIGELVGAFACVAQNHLYWHSHKRNEVKPGTPIPEARLPLSIFGSFVGLTGGLFFYGWTSDSSFHWIVPSVALGFIGFGIMTVVQAVSTYVTDSYASMAASAMAAVSLGEYIFAAWLPLSAKAMYTDLGFKWASSTLGFLALVLSFAPVALLWKGHKVREKSKFIE